MTTDETGDFEEYLEMDDKEARDTPAAPPEGSDEEKHQQEPYPDPETPEKTNKQAPERAAGEEAPS